MLENLKTGDDDENLIAYFGLDCGTIPKPQKTSKTADKVNRRLKWRRIVFESEEIGEQNDYQAL